MMASDFFDVLADEGRNAQGPNGFFEAGAANSVGKDAYDPGRGRFDRRGCCRSAHMRSRKTWLALSVIELFGFPLFEKGAGAAVFVFDGTDVGLLYDFDATRGVAHSYFGPGLSASQDLIDDLRDIVMNGEFIDFHDFDDHVEGRGRFALEDRLSGYRAFWPLRRTG